VYALDVDETIGQLTQVRMPCRLKKTLAMNYESRHSKCSFALSILMLEINLNDQDVFHKPA